FYFFIPTITSPSRSTLFPYTTLFRSIEACIDRHVQLREAGEVADDIDFGDFHFVRDLAARQVLRKEIGFLRHIESGKAITAAARSEEHTSELQSLAYLVCRLLLEKKN